MVKYIIFDFGGVFLNLDGNHSGIPAQLAEIFKIPIDQANKIWGENKVDLLTGRETPKNFINKINNLLKFSIDIEQADQKWEALNKMEKSHIDWDLVEYVEGLKNNYQIHMLTDTIAVNTGNSDWFGDISKHFHNIFKSFEIGHRKPDKESFLYVLKKIGATPDECVFVDDFQKNVDAANELGLKGILYTNLNQLKTDLSAIGLASDLIK